MQGKKTTKDDDAATDAEQDEHDNEHAEKQERINNNRLTD